MSHHRLTVCQCWLRNHLGDEEEGEECRDSPAAPVPPEWRCAAAPHPQHSWQLGAGSWTGTCRRQAGGTSGPGGGACRCAPTGCGSAAAPAALLCECVQSPAQSGKSPCHFTGMRDGVGALLAGGGGGLQHSTDVLHTTALLDKGQQLCRQP